MKHLSLSLALGALCASLAINGAYAQAYPAQPVRLVVPFGPGGVTDITARVFAEGLSRELGQPVIVENRAGAGGAIAASAVAKARADGYTLLVVTNGVFAVNPQIYPKLPYDPKTDFVYVAMMANTPTILAVNAKSPITSLPELIRTAKAAPQSLSFSTAGEGSDNDQVLRLLEQAADVQLLHVPFKSGNESLTAILGGTADVTAVSSVTAGSYIKSMQIRPFAVTSSRRLPGFPDIPTVKEAIGTEVEGGSLSGIAAPAGTPASIVARLNAAVAKTAASPMVQEKIYANGSEPVNPSQAVFSQRVRDEQAKWEKILKPAKE